MNYFIICITRCKTYFDWNKKTCIFLFFISFISPDLLAQKDIEVFDKEAGNFEIQGVPGNGFLLFYNKNDIDAKLYEYYRYPHLFSSSPPKEKSEMRKYNNDIELDWKLEVDQYRSFFSSPGGKYTFMTNITVNKTDNTKMHNFFRIDNNGGLTEMNCKLNEKLIGINDFAMGKQFYRLNLVRDEKTHMSDGTLELIRINIDEKTVDQIKLELPERKFAFTCTGWKYAAHDNNTIYLCCRTFNLDTRKYICELILLDTNGNIINEIEAIGKTKECIYPSSSMNTFPGIYGDYPFDVNGYLNVLVDTLNKCFYVYGLQGNCAKYMQFVSGYGHAYLRPKRKGFLATSVYIHKYNFDGEEEFKIEEKLTPFFQEKWVFRYNELQYTAVRIDTDNNFEMCPVAQIIKNNVSISERIAFHVIVSPDGDIMKKKEVHYFGQKYNAYNLNPYKADGPFTILDTDPDVAVLTKSKSWFFKTYDTGKGKVVLRYDQKEKTMKFQVYKN